FVLGLIIFFVVWQRDEKQVRASQALSNVSSKQMAAAGKQDNPQDYLKVASDYPSSKAGARAVILGASTLFTDGKYADAQAQFEKFTREYRESPLLPNALIGIASS